MTKPPAYSYVGEELDLFRAARRWKRYVAARLAPYISGDVLEVGAGIGGTTRALADHQRSWTCLEPDASLAARLQESLNREPLALPCRAIAGTVADLPPDEAFDCILYIDVLEHIADDRAELERASQHLRRGGHLVVLAPAHQWLYSEFDRSIGHERRYTSATLRAAGPPLRVLASFYLDSVGMFASAANRLLLRRDLPTPAQIRFWDGWLVRASRWLDPVLGRRVGKTVVVVWAK